MRVGLYSPAELACPTHERLYLKLFLIANSLFVDHIWNFVPRGATPTHSATTQHARGIARRRFPGRGPDRW